MRTLRILAAAALAVPAAAGVGIQLAYPIGDGPPVGMLRYFTIQSNLLVAACALAEFVLLAAGRTPGRRFAVLRGASLLAIGVTGVVFQTLLSAVWRPTGIQGLANGLLHLWVPLLAAAFWLAFAEKGLLRPRDALAWLAYPAAYLAWSLVHGAATGFYPYWFLNPVAPPPEGMGSPLGVATFAAAAAASFLVLGLGLVRLDGALGRSAAKRPKDRNGAAA